MKDPREMEEGEVRPLGLAETRATDGRHLALAQTHASLDSRQDPPRLFGAAETQVFGPDSQEPQAFVDIAARDTLESGLHGGLARPELAGREEHRRRDLLKAKLFGEAEAAVKIGRFAVLGRLGAGGMGIVYTAYDERLDRKIAIKVLRPESSGGQSRVRLLREAQAMARLSHPNIVGVHEVGEDGDSVFVAMEFVRGESLDRWLEQRRAWRAVVEVFMAAGRGLQAAHAAGMIHRDFKPANAILADDGRVKVLDFGLARAGAAATGADEAEVPASEHSLMEVRLTRTGAMMGTPAYMSPEQLLGEELGPASDQFSFFVALYEGLYGALPFSGASLTELITSVTQGRPGDAPITSDVPTWLRRVILRGLARAPAERWPDMATALAALASDPSRRRRRMAALLGLVVASAGASAAVMQVAAPAGQCEGLASATEQVWNGERVMAARAAFSTSAGPLGVETWALIEPRLTAWNDEWIALRGERCEARADGRISDMLHDRSIACLERQLARVDGLVGAFVIADATSVEQAPAAVAALPSLAMCSDADYLMAEVRPPEDPQARVQVAEGRATLERARAAIDLGDYAGGLRLASTVAALGRTLDHEPLVALAEVVRGDALQWQREVGGAEAALSAGVELGLASGDDRAAVEALARRIYVRAELAGHAEQALADAAIGRALLRRVGADPRLTWLLENNVAVAHERAGAYDAATRGYEAALRLADEGSYEAVVTQFNFGLLSGRLNRFDHADQLFAGAIAAGERLLGPHHPMLLPLLEGQAKVAFTIGRSTRARGLLVRAREIHARLPTPSPALLLIVALEAESAAQRRESTAPALAAEAETLAAAVDDGPSRAYTLLRSQAYQNGREADYAAALEFLRGLEPELWGEGLRYRVDALLHVDRPTQVLATLEAARSAGPWDALNSDARVALGLVETEALIDLGRTSEAATVLDEVETRVGVVASRWLRPRIDYHRGRLAELRGDLATAVVDLRRAAESYALTFDGDHPEQLEVRFALARALRGAGSRGEAGSLARSVLAAYVTLGPGFAAEAAAIEAWLAAR